MKKLLPLLLLLSSQTLCGIKVTPKKTVKKVAPKKSTPKVIVATVTEKNFEKAVLKSKTPVLLDVYADWCGPCRRMAPVLEEVAQKFKPKKIKFAKIKMDSFQESDKHIKLLKSKLGAEITMIPTFLYINDGKLVETIVGSQTSSVLNKKVANLIKPKNKVLS